MSSVKRSVSPRTKKKKSVQNVFDLIQLKKMIGKNLVIAFKGAERLNDVQLTETNILALKNKILTNNVKVISLTGFLSVGVLNIFEGVDRLLAINAITYADIKKTNLDIDIVITQYKYITPKDLLS